MSIQHFPTVLPLLTFGPKIRAITRDVTTCSPVEMHQHFGGTYRLHLHSTLSLSTCL